MTVDRTIVLLTENEFETAVKSAEPHEGEFWFHHCDTKNHFWFGETTDSVPQIVLHELAALKPKVDKVTGILRYLFLESSDSQQVDMFERFLIDNLGKNKIVRFWSQ